jgi:hypothetical protein
MNGKMVCGYCCREFRGNLSPREPGGYQGNCPTCGCKYETVPTPPTTKNCDTCAHKDAIVITFDPCDGCLQYVNYLSLEDLEEL